MHAAMLGRKRIIALLLEKGARADAQDDDGQTAIYCAAGNVDEPEIINMLIAAGGDPEVTVPCEATALCIASEKGHLRTVQTLLAHGANPNHVKDGGETPIYLAALFPSDGHADTIRALAAAGGEPNPYTSAGATPMCAVWNFFS